MHAHRALSENNDAVDGEGASDESDDDSSSGGEEEIEFEDDIVYLRSLDPKVGITWHISHCTQHVHGCPWVVHVSGDHIALRNKQ